MRWVVLAAVLAGCSSVSSDAERQYEIVSRSGTPAAKCEASRKVADAYLADKNEEAYGRWQLTSRIDCTSAGLDAQTP